MSKRIAYLSRLKAAACIAVVLLHTFYAADAFSAEASWHAVMLGVRNLMMWAVPCFVMATGALLLENDRKLPLNKLFGKLIMRMFVTLVTFTLLFAVFDLVLVTKSFTPAAMGQSIKSIFTGSSWRHMWYLYLMIGLYLMMPIYRLITKSAEDKDLVYILAVYGVFLALLPMCETLLNIKLSFYICVYTVYPLYLFLGYAMNKGSIKLGGVLSAVFAAGGAVIILGLTVFTAYHESSITSLLGTYNFPVTVLMSAGVWGLFMAGKDKEHPTLDKLCAEIEGCSFGIYLIHMAVLKLVFAVFRLNPVGHGGVLTVLLIAVGALAVSYVIIKLLKLVPAVKEII